MSVQPNHIVREELEALEYEQPSVPPDDLQFQSFSDLLTPDRGKSSIRTFITSSQQEQIKSQPRKRISGKAWLFSRTSNSIDV